MIPAGAGITRRVVYGGSTLIYFISQDNICIMMHSTCFVAQCNYVSVKPEVR
jgi:hypothetical protein